MTYADPPDLSDNLFGDDERNLAMRLWHFVVNKRRPVLGWVILLLVLLLTWLPIQAANVNEWIILGSYINTLAPLGPLGLLLTWWIMGWRRPRDLSQLAPGRANRHVRILGLILLIMVIGLICLTQALVGWIPGPIRFTQGILADGGTELGAQMGSDLAIIGTRLVRWWSGVWAGGATQDDLVFAAFAGLIAWLNGILTGYLVRRGYSGLLCGTPSLWLLIIALLYGSAGRMIFVTGLLVVLLLHVLLDERRLHNLWDASGISYSEGLVIDRLLYVLVAGFLIFGTASLMPNVTIDRLAKRYFQLYRPISDQVEGFGQRLFPDLKATSRFRGSALSTGLPNSFLLGAGPELSQTEVMRFRTDEVYSFEPEIMEEVPVTGHYIRGGTLTNYDGLGWTNPSVLERVTIAADLYISNLLVSEPLSIVADAVANDTGDADSRVEGENNVSKDRIELPRGRRLLTQDIFLRFNSRGLYGVAEPLSFSVDYRVDQRGVGDQASIWVDPSHSGGSPGTSSYTVVSAIPAVNEAALAEEVAVNPNDEDPLWNELIRHLELPDTVTDRTKQLALDLTSELEGPYLKATAIEAYLRTFEYDLSVSKPPEDVVDVADYFLFELQRGYCDYYATAFIVLARLAGLPARFATGFAVGSWNSAQGMWVVTEAEAHSWPEIYFPSYGWIAFEPTAGRAALFRLGVGPETDAPLLPAITIPQTTAVTDEQEASWNWQMLVWLLPLGLLGWGIYRLAILWQHKREDPWTFILRWGQRIGRPMQSGETVLEYGQGLSDFVLERYRHNNQDTGRRIARGITSLSEQLTTAQYGTLEQRTTASHLIDEQWGMLRAYVSQLSRFCKYILGRILRLNLCIKSTEIGLKFQQNG